MTETCHCPNRDGEKAVCLKLDLWKERHFGTCSSSNHQDNYVISQTLIVILSRKSQLDIVGTAASVFLGGSWLP